MKIKLNEIKASRDWIRMFNEFTLFERIGFALFPRYFLNLTERDIRNYKG